MSGLPASVGASAFHSMDLAGLQLLHKDPLVHRRIRTNTKEHHGAARELVLSRHRWGDRIFFKPGVCAGEADIYVLNVPHTICVQPVLKSRVTVAHKYRHPILPRRSAAQ